MSTLNVPSRIHGSLAAVLRWRSVKDKAEQVHNRCAAASVRRTTRSSWVMGRARWRVWNGWCD